jgi:hypothetical protein
MLSDDLSNLRDWINRRADEDGSLTLPADLTAVLRFMLRDMCRAARAMEVSQISGPATITSEDLASGKVKLLPIVPRLVRADNDERGPVA